MYREEKIERCVNTKGVECLLPARAARDVLHGGVSSCNRDRFSALPAGATSTRLQRPARRDKTEWSLGWREGDACIHA